MAIKDKAASALARLHTKAAAIGESYQQTLLLFCQEELMRRIALSPYADKLILKGGLFLYLAMNHSGRTTMDADFLLRNLSNDEATIRTMLGRIIAAPTENEYVTFDVLGLKPIALQQQYHGMQASIVAHIKRVRVPLFVDFGIGDVIVPSPETRTLCPLLPDNTAPQILTYSLESTIAEKYDAIVQRMEQTSRMKDFFDICNLSRTFPFHGATLQRAVRETLAHRGTHHDAKTFSYVEKLASMPEMHRKWLFFNRSLSSAAMPFDEAMQQIILFLKPVVATIVADGDFKLSWVPGQGWQ